MATWSLLAIVLFVWIIGIYGSVLEAEIEDAQRGVPEDQRRSVSILPVFPLFPLAFWGIALLINRFVNPWGTLIIGGLHLILGIVWSFCIYRYRRQLAEINESKKGIDQSARQPITASLPGNADRSQPMIVRTNMFEPLLEACPSFRPAWDEFLQEWSDDADPPDYLALGELARHLIAMLERGDTDTFPEIFAVIERWHVEGEHYVQEAATIGLLEGLQNRNLHSRTEPEQFRPYLLPESERWWDKLYDFWRYRKPLNDD